VGFGSCDRCVKVLHWRFSKRFISFLETLQCGYDYEFKYLPPAAEQACSGFMLGAANAHHRLVELCKDLSDELAEETAAHEIMHLELLGRGFAFARVASGQDPSLWKKTATALHSWPADVVIDRLLVEAGYSLASYRERLHRDTMMEFRSDQTESDTVSAVAYNSLGCFYILTAENFPQRDVLLAQYREHAPLAYSVASELVNISSSLNYHRPPDFFQLLCEFRQALQVEPYVLVDLPQASHTAYIPSYINRTPRLDCLIGRANRFARYQPIRWGIMTDPVELRRTGGGMVEQGPFGVASIRIDPGRADEYIVAHEVMHVFLNRVGYPKLAAALQGDQWAKQVADSVDNLTIHPLLNESLQSVGIQPAKAIERFLEGFDTWPTREPDQPAGILINAFKILEALLYEDRFPAIVVAPLGDRLGSGHSNTVKLAHRLFRCLRRTNRTKSPLVYREMQVRVLDRVENWMRQATGEEQRLVASRIMVTLFLTRTQLELPAKAVLRPYEESICVGHKEYNVVGFRYVQDNTIARAYQHYGRDGEQEVRRILRDFRDLSTEAFLQRHWIQYSVRA